MAVEAPSELSESELDLPTGRFWINPIIPDPYLSMPEIPAKLISNALDQLDHTRAPLYEQTAIRKAEDELIRHESEKRAQRTQEDVQRNLARVHLWVHRFWEEEDGAGLRRPWGYAVYQAPDCAETIE